VIQCMRANVKMVVMRNMQVIVCMIVIISNIIKDNG
jgi:hypothetical protein